MYRTLLCGVLFTTMLLNFDLYSAHIVGGDVTYKCLENNPILGLTKFRVTFTMYRDSKGGGAPFDGGASFGLFRKEADNTWTIFQVVQVNPTSITNLALEEPCVIVPSNIGVQRGFYIFDINIPQDGKDYQIVYQRCCRNNTISNLVLPGETGAAFYTEISNEAISNCNNSPIFKKFPPILICNQKPLNFDHSATDEDGDQLVYEFCAPLTAGGTNGTMGGNAAACDGVRPDPRNCPPPYEEVTFVSSLYTGSNPMGGNPIVSINTQSGLISGTPQITGQFVVGICVKEFRNGELIGITRRDFQFNVVNCEGPSETIEEEICSGSSVKVNNIEYNKAGSYTQTFTTATGCDSTLTINISEKQNSFDSIAYQLCSGGTVTLNNQTYDKGGIYTQKLIAQNGCDSTLKINIKILPPKVGVVEYSICQGSSIIVNGKEYNKTGNYVQELKTLGGCDSTLNVSIFVRPVPESTQNLILCEDESLNINGQIYNTGGQFTQNLKTPQGCDSLLRLNISEKPKYETVLNYNLCQDGSAVVNGQTYNAEGQYVQVLNSQFGCDSTLVINVEGCDKSFSYNFDACDALIPTASMDYNEFVPLYSIENVTCGNIAATNVYRDNANMNKHSCTQGRNGTIAMCVSSNLSCNANSNTVTPITFEFDLKPSDNFDIAFSKLVFHQKAPENYSWIAGNSGKNNYPTKYRIKIFKNNVEVFSQSDVSTTLDWREENYEFAGNSNFTVSGDSKFKIEISPYCAVGNGATVSAWDIEDVEIFTNCINKGMRTVSGHVDVNLKGAKARAIYANQTLESDINSAGKFSFENLDASKEYKIEIFYNEEHGAGINTLDLILIQQHILGLSKFTIHKDFHAADANNDKKVSVSDLVELRKIILGIKKEFSNNESYKFLNQSELESETSPWKVSTHYMLKPGNINMNNLSFVAVKIGDLK